jgi:SAM-dependent methyltransferase
VLLTITATAPLTAPEAQSPATDLGFLLHKNPQRVQSFDVSAGVAHVFYPEASASRCTAALLLEVDPVGLVRGRRQGAQPEGFSLGQYVNDRPYAASSLLAVALSRVFRTAMTGRCDARPELAAESLPLEIRVPVLPCRGGRELAGALFEPLGWQVRCEPIALDETIPSWGDSRYLDLLVSGQVRLADALNHLYVLLPVLDDAKHYWVSPEEVDKLIRAGGGWLAGHPARGLITRRYLAHRSGLYQSAIARLAEVDDAAPESFDNAVPEQSLAEQAQPDPAAPDATGTGPTGTGSASTESASTDPASTDPASTDPASTDPASTDPASTDPASTEPASTDPASTGPDHEPGQPASLAQQRRDAVLAILRAAGAQRVADLGCGEGALTAQLLADRQFTEVIAADVSSRALTVAERRLRLDRMPDRQRSRLRLIQSSLTYRDPRLAGLDALVLVEVVEHVDPSRLGALERTVFGAAAPGLVVVTTPNAEYNVRYDFLAPGAMRHRDHRFEWTRAEFNSWAGRVAAEHGYLVTFHPVGDDDPEVGPPTQLAVFTAASRAAVEVTP